jgi:S1-C subfamily serine protease
MVKVRLCALALLMGLALAAAQRAAGETVLLDFTSPHCPPCREMEPVLAQLTARGHDVRPVDVTRDGDAARQFRVEATPTYIVLVDGREWARLTGKSDLATMEGMLRKATELAEAKRAAAPASEATSPRGSDGYVTPVSTFASEAVGGAPAARGGAAQPMEGRVTPMRNPFAGAATSPPAQARGSQAADSYAATPSAAAAPSADAARLIASTVRLSIADPGGKSTGTGAIIDARNGRALVLTCGHLFRESGGRGAIEVSLFAAGAGGAEVRGTVPGELLDYDLERDLALVRFEMRGEVPVTPVAPLGTQLEPGAAVTSVGCSHGENPTAWSTRITTINRYQGYPNVEAARAPVEGRSGGPLYNAAGQVIGVCFAANPEDDEGLYASLASIHAKLDELQMSAVYQSPGIGNEGPAAPPAGQFADAGPQSGAPQDQLQVRGQDPTPPPSSMNDAWPSGAEAAAPTGVPAFATMSAEERAAIEEIARRSGGAEVICIIRPRTPDGRSDVIKLDGVSADFVKALTASAKSASVDVASRGVPAPGPGASVTR